MTHCPPGMMSLLQTETLSSCETCPRPASDISLDHPHSTIEWAGVHILPALPGNYIVSSFWKGDIDCLQLCSSGSVLML